MSNSVAEIRKNERKSHTEMYNRNNLYTAGSWLHKPVKAVCDILPFFEGYRELRVLDLGCGVGRNSICVARKFCDLSTTIECVDLLKIAIDKLRHNAKKYGVSKNIVGIVKSIEDYNILSNAYDLIISVSAIEHVRSMDVFLKKLLEIKNGIKKGGFVCLLINSSITETNLANGDLLSPQFEINLPSKELFTILNQTFTNWDIIESSTKAQEYNIPREMITTRLHANVVTFVARNKG